MTNEVPSRPIVRWHGGKWLLAPWILSNFPKHRIYTEAFGGAASVLMQKPRSYAEVYNDIDDDIVNLFRIVRDPYTAQELYNALKLTPYSKTEYQQSFEMTLNVMEAARRLVVRSFMGFSSNSSSKDEKLVTGFRANSNRSGTTPAQDWKNYPDCLPALIERLQGVIIENREATEVLIQYDGPQTLHYLDPPYAHETRTKQAVGNYKHEMTDEQHRHLAFVAKGLRGMVVISGYESTLYDELYGSWVKIERAAYGDGAAPRKECLWLNDMADHFRPQGTLL